MTICPLMLLTSLFGFGQSFSAVESRQLVLDSYQQSEDIEQAAKLLR